MFQVVQYSQKKNAIECADRVRSQIHHIARYRFNVWCDIPSYQLETFEAFKMGMFPGIFIECHNPFRSPPYGFNAKVAVPCTHIQNRLSLDWIFERDLRFQANTFFAVAP